MMVLEISPELYLISRRSSRILAIMCDWFLWKIDETFDDLRGDFEVGEVIIITKRYTCFVSFFVPWIPGSLLLQGRLA